MSEQGRTDWDFLNAFLSSDGESVDELLDDAEEAYLGCFNTGLDA
tara:strand:+ start:3552 stop:3686 length:135 start_codon:yes stop_codon:yes gene_type:complete